MISGVCQNVTSRHEVDGMMEMAPLGALCGDLESFAFALHPIGNSPELVPLDWSLDKDLDDAVIHHILLTSHIDDVDPLKFCLSTVKRGALA